MEISEIQEKSIYGFAHSSLVVPLKKAEVKLPNKVKKVEPCWKSEKIKYYNSKGKKCISFKTPKGINLDVLI